MDDNCGLADNNSSTQGRSGQWASPAPDLAAGGHPATNRERRIASAAFPGYHIRMRIEGLLLDLDGTLHVGGEPIEGAREAVERLAASGLALRYVTNTTRKPRRAVREQLYALGFEVEEAQIFTPARAATNGPASSDSPSRVRQ